MEDNSPDSQHLRGATPASAEELFDGRDSQLKDPNPVPPPSTPAVKLDSNSATTTTTTTTTTYREASQPINDRPAHSPAHSAEEENELWNYADSRIFLTERLETQEDRSTQSGEGGERNGSGQSDPATGDDSTKKPRREAPSKTHRKKSAKQPKTGLSDFGETEDSRTGHRHFDKNTRPERTKNSKETQTESLSPTSGQNLLNHQSVEHWKAGAIATEQGEDEPRAAETGREAIIQYRFQQDQNYSTKSPETGQDSGSFSTQTGTGRKKPSPRETILQENRQKESRVDGTNKAFDERIKPELLDNEYAGYVEEERSTLGSRFRKRQSSAEVRSRGSSVSGRPTSNDKDIELHGHRLVKHEGNSYTVDAGSTHTRSSSADKDDAAEDFAEHEDTIEFNFTILLQNECPSKHQLDKKQSVTSKESPEIPRQMAATQFDHSLDSQMDPQLGQDSSGEQQTGQIFERQSDSEHSASRRDEKPDHRDGGSRLETRDSENDVDKRRQPSQASIHSAVAKSELPDSKSSMDRTHIEESSNPGDIQQELQNPENDTDALGQGSDHQNDTQQDDQRPSSTDDGDREYGSPTKPKPPVVPFQKPSPQRMAELDRHVLATPKQLTNFPVYELAQYLLRPARTEVETAYVIFRWVTCQHVRQGKTTPAAEGEEGEKNEGGDMEVNVPTLGTYVEQIQSGRIDHADLFSVLCKCINLETHKIEGRLRFYCPQPSPQLCRARGASWSAVLLPGGWGIVDCALGARLWASEAVHRTSIQRAHHRSQAGNIPSGEPTTAPTGNVDTIPSKSDRQRRSGERSESAIFRAYEEYSPQNFYFLPPPQLLVSSHLPDNPCWQLLPHPVAETDFLTSLLKKPHLHYLGVDITSPVSLRLTEISEEMDVTWKLKGEGLRRFAFRFFSLSSSSNSSHQELTRHGFLENQHSRGAVNLRLTPPTSGRYVCELYGTYLPARGNEMIHMCSFDLDFVKTTSTPLKFPHNDRVEWGPGAECVALGLTPVTHVTGCVNVDKGETELVFSLSKPILVTQKLYSAAEEGQGTEAPHSTINFRDSKNKIKILLRIPDPGDYVLSIYAKEESSPGKCHLVCNYLVLCDSGTPEVVHPFPSLPFNKLGPTKAFFDLNMKLVCPKRSCIVVAPYSGKVTFVFRSADDAELSCDLLHQGQGGEEVTDCGEYVQHTCQSGESVFRARLPLAGDYLFHLYGKPSDGEGHKFLLYSALVECAVPNRDCLPLPRVVPEWRSRVQILAPLRKCLVLGALTHFAVRAYRVKAVAIVSQSGVQNFVNEDEEDDEGKDNDGDGNEDVTETTETKELDENVGIQQKSDEKDRRDEDLGHQGTANRSSETQTQTAGWNEKGDPQKNHDEDTDSATAHHHDPDEHPTKGNDPPENRATFATKKVTMKQEHETEDDYDDIEDEWQVWRCKVKVGREDEGSGVKLCIQTASTPDSHMICVAEFEVITERNMAAKLDHQHSLWAAAEDNFKVRPDSGHRSDIDDEERQSAYFLDDEVYLSNPLGDDNSDSDDSDLFSQEDYEDSTDDADTVDDSDSDFEDTATSSSGTVKPDHQTAGPQDSTSKPHRQTGAGAAQGKPDRGVPAAKKTITLPQKADKERAAGRTKKAFHPESVYNAPQPFSIRESRQKAALAQKQKMEQSVDARGAKKKTRPGQEERRKETGEEKSCPPGLTSSEGEKNEAAEASHKNKKKRADGSTIHQDSGTRERSLRRKLWKTCQRREREAIRKAVKHYTRGGYPPCPDLAAAERLLHLFKLQDALIDALASNDMDAIRHALTEVERHGYAGEMSVECRKAHAMLSPHRHRSRLPDLQLETDMRTLREIRSYRCPPRVVHHVIVAALLLLGFHEGQTKTWKRCRQRLQVLGRQGILKKMLKFREDVVHPEIWARARQLLDKHTTEEAQNAGPGILAVFRWANNVMSRVKNLAELDEAYTSDGSSGPPQPASKRRQREIFRQRVTTTTTDTSTTTTQSQDSSSGSEVQKMKSGKQVGAETPRNKSSNNNKPVRESKDRQKKGATNDREKSFRKPENAAVRKEPGSHPGKDVTKKTTGRQNVQTDTKTNPQSGSSLKPASNLASKSDSSQVALNSNSNNATKSKPVQDNTPANARQTQQNLSDEHKTQSSGYQPRPKSSPQDKPEKNNTPAIVSEQARPTQFGGSSQKTSMTPKSSPENSAKSSTVSHSASKQPEEVRRPQQTSRPSTVRYEEPQERLRSLSPHKSPLFRPANKTKNKADTVRSRPLVTSHRPKTTPTPVLQSTFFFASLVGKEEADEEVNNNIPMTFKNYSNGAGNVKTTRSAGADSRAGSMTETRLGSRANQRQAAGGRHSITTPDI